MTKIEPEHLSTLFICASRYTHGRATYIVGEIADMTKRYWSDFKPSTRYVLHRDLRELIDEHVRVGRNIGWDCDRDVWLDLLNFMESELGLDKT